MLKESINLLLKLLRINIRDNRKEANVGVYIGNFSGKLLWKSILYYHYNEDVKILKISKSIYYIYV